VGHPPRKSRPGTGRALHPNPDRTIERRLANCPKCEAVFPEASQTPQQVYDRIELPPMGPYIDEKSGKSVPGVRLPFIPISGLPPGDYRLLLPDENRSVDIKVSKGTIASGWVYGSGRALQLSVTKPLNIARIDAGPGELVVTVTNTNPFTRVHVAATRYIDNGTRLATLMAFSRVSGGSEVPARLPNLYSAGRDIGDEYRYILERRYAQKFPGNMLSRPGLILNPWEKRKTDQAGLDQKAMEQAAANLGANRWRVFRWRSITPASIGTAIRSFFPIRFSSS